MKQKLKRMMEWARASRKHAIISGLAAGVSVALVAALICLPWALKERERRAYEMVKQAKMQNANKGENGNK